MFREFFGKRGGVLPEEDSAVGFDPDSDVDLEELTGVIISRKEVEELAEIGEAAMAFKKEFGVEKGMNIRIGHGKSRFNGRVVQFREQLPEKPDGNKEYVMVLELSYPKPDSPQNKFKEFKLNELLP